MLALTQAAILLYIDSIFYASSLRRKVLGGSRIEDRGSRIEDRGSCRISMFNLIFNPRYLILDPRPNDGPCRIRTYNQRIMLTTTAFAALLTRPNQSLWSGLSLHFTCLPSSLYTFIASSEAWLGVTISPHQPRLPRS